MKKIVICNDGVDSPNKGDQAILHAMMDDLKRYIPQVKIEFFSYSGMRTIRKLSNFISVLKRSDIFILGGGHAFQDLTSQAFLFFGLFLIIMAKIFGKKVMCYAVGVGPIDTKMGKYFSRLILNMSDIISVRDEVSKNILEVIGIKREKILVTADAAFTLKSVEPKKAEKILLKEGIKDNKKPLIAVCLRRWFYFRHNFFPEDYRMKKKKEGKKDRKTKETLAGFFDFIIERYKVEIVFIPMRRATRKDDFGQDDDNYSLEILEIMKHKEDTYLLKDDYSPQELKGIFGKMDLVISIRMHPLILAASYGVPIIGIPFTASKGEGFFNAVNQPDNFIYIDAINCRNLIMLFNIVWKEREKIREDLKEHLYYLQERTLMNIKLVKTLLEN